MSSSNIQENRIADQLILDIKALVLLAQNDDALLHIIKERVIGSHDEQVGKFMLLLRPKKMASQRGSFLIALAELVLASFLSILGLSLMAPSLMGFQTPAQLLAYFRQLTLSLSTTSFSNPILPVMDLLLSLALLVGAFYVLRRASSDLKEAGMYSETKP